MAARGRRDMPTDGALSGPYGGYSELSAGGARSAGASPNDRPGLRWLAGYAAWGRRGPSPRGPRSADQQPFQIRSIDLIWCGPAGGIACMAR
eukprot:COSAG01_NODE_13186_length_1623_cov_1.528871_2_plen_91_part_01